MKKYSLLFLSGIGAGAAIGLGGFLYVLITAFTDKLPGSIAFAVGLFLVCFFALHLYTGKIGFAFDQKRKSYVIDLLVMLIGNAVGAYLFGLLMRATQITSVPEIANKIQSICSMRMVGINETWYDALKSSIFCGALVFLAVYFYKNNKHFIFKVLALVICVTIFVYFGFEHVIANIFYFSLGGVVDVSFVSNLFICAIGNSLGAWAIRAIVLFIDKLR